LTWVIIYFLIPVLPLVAGFVAVTKIGNGVPSFNEVASLPLLYLGFLLCFWGAVALAGGPEGRFLSSGTLGFGALCTAIALTVVLFALWLLSVPMVWAALFLAPAVLLPAAIVIRSPPLGVFGLTAVPVACLVVIMVLWVRAARRAQLSCKRGRELENVT